MHSHCLCLPACILRVSLSVFVRLCTQRCLGSKSATWGWELLVMAGREHSVVAACSDGDSHLEERLWLSFASKQSNKSLWRLTAELRYRGEQLQANKCLLSFEEGTFFLVSLDIFFVSFSILRVLVSVPPLNYAFLPARHSHFTSVHCRQLAKETGSSPLSLLTATSGTIKVLKVKVGLWVWAETANVHIDESRAGPPVIIACTVKLRAALNTVQRKQPGMGG